MVFWLILLTEDNGDENFMRLFTDQTIDRTYECIYKSYAYTENSFVWPNAPILIIIRKDFDFVTILYLQCVLVGIWTSKNYVYSND